MQAQSIPIGRQTITGRTALEGHTIHIPDVLADPEPSALQENARATILRFGCYTEGSGREAEGQTFKLAARAIEKSSPTVGGLDYLLSPKEAQCRVFRHAPQTRLLTLWTARVAGRLA